MSLILVLALQAAAAAPAPLPARPRWAMADRIAYAAGGPGDPLAFDLARIRPAGAGSCLGAPGSDVLVCGPRRSGGAYPMDHWARIFGPPAPVRAEMDLGGNVQGRIHSEAVPMDRGAVSNRVMVGIRWPF
jgi:hypothetical protein